MSLLEECVAYLQEPGFQRMIEAWIEKYKSLGYLGGRIKIDHLSFVEQEALGLLLGLDLSCGYLHITYAQFLKKFQQTRFEDVDFLEVLKNLQSSPIYTKKEISYLKNETEEIFKQSLLRQYQDTKAYPWLYQYLYETKLANKYIHDHDSLFDQQLCFVCDALNHLPIYEQHYQLLPIFSQAITKNPHYFDDDFVKELLLKGIEYSFHLVPRERTVENINDLLYHVGLLRDDLSNNCYICHIRPQEDLLGWVGFYQNYEPWNMNLYNLTQVSSLFEQMPIYIVENPSIFRFLASEIHHRHLHTGLICGNGQLNLCTYMLLDRLVESECHLYYAGDYDPEGLLIADKLKQRYGDSLSLWCYDIQHFEGISVQKSSISQKRLQILKNIQNEELKKIAEYMIKEHVFAYQEGCIDIYKTNIG